LETTHFPTPQATPHGTPVHSPSSAQFRNLLPPPTVGMDFMFGRTFQKPNPEPPTSANNHYTTQKLPSTVDNHYSCQQNYLGDHSVNTNEYSDKNWKNSHFGLQFNSISNDQFSMNQDIRFHHLIPDRNINSEVLLNHNYITSNNDQNGLNLLSLQSANDHNNLESIATISANQQQLPIDSMNRMMSNNYMDNQSSIISFDTRAFDVPENNFNKYTGRIPPRIESGLENIYRGPSTTYYRFQPGIKLEDQRLSEPCLDQRIDYSSRMRSVNFDGRT
jgi:hypothetical protein